jgi:hypothetical protein
MQLTGKSLKSASKICDVDYTDQHVEELHDLMLQLNFGRHDKVDRGTYMHNYHRVYGKLLGPDRYKIRNVLEVGIWTGLGLLTWANYFPNSQVEGVDKLFQWETKIKRLFEQDGSYRINLNWADTTNEEVLRLHFPPKKYDTYFDVIFDDGNHFASGQMATLINCWQYLKPGGWYFIEDLTEKFEPSNKLLEYIDMLGEQGHEIGWFHYPDDLKTHFDPKVFMGSMHKSNLISIKKKPIMKEE